MQLEWKRVNSTPRHEQIRDSFALRGEIKQPQEIKPPNQMKIFFACR